MNLILFELPFISLFLLSLNLLISYYLGRLDLIVVSGSVIILTILFIAFRKTTSIPKLSALIVIIILSLASLFVKNTSQIALLSGTDSNTYLFTALNLVDPSRFHFTVLASPPLFPLILSYVYKTLGLSWVFYTNSFVFIIFLTIFFLYIRRLFNLTTALLSLFLLAINIGEIFTAKSLLREMCGAVYFFGFLYFISTKSYWLKSIGCLSFFFSLFMRPELILVLPLLWFLKGKNLFTALFSTSLALLFGVINYQSRIHYFSSEFLSTLPIYIYFVPIPLLVATFIVLKSKIIEKINILKLIDIGSLCLIFYFVLNLYRFYSNRFFLQNPVAMLFSTHINFDWISLERLLLFLPAPILILGTINIYRQLKNYRQLSFNHLLYLLFSLGFTLAFLYSPYHDPNIRYWVRRFAVITIPFIIAYGSNYFVLLNISSTVKTWLLFFFLVVFSYTQLPSYFTSEYDTLLPQIQSISQKYSQALCFLEKDQSRADYRFIESFKLFSPHVTLLKNIADAHDCHLITFGYKEELFNYPLESTEVIEYSRLEWAYYSIPTQAVPVKITLNVYQL